MRKSRCARSSTPRPPVDRRRCLEMPAGPLWQHLDVRRYAEATRLSVLPVVIEATMPTGGDDALARDRPAPDLGIERHRIYMVQWYAFAAMALAFWAWFVLRPRLF